MLTTLPQNELLDLQPWVGQRSASFIFKRINGLTSENLGLVHPIRTATLTHDTSRTIKRQLNLALGEEDTANLSPLTDRILPYMQLGDGSLWPLGRYMFTDETKTKFTSGDLANVVLNDEMFLIDQEITTGYDATSKTLPRIYSELLADTSIEFVAEQSEFVMAQSWTIGTQRGSIMGAVAVTGDYFNPWMGNDSKLHVVRTFNPANQIPQFDWDAGNQVYRIGITQTSNILTAPNQFVVVSNTGANGGPVVGNAKVPSNAPNSFANRGFYITSTQTLQLSDPTQAQAVANGLANRQTIFETVTLNTSPDPRHDSYDVIRWQGALWLELAWAMELKEGGRMSHTIRKGYSSQ